MTVRVRFAPSPTGFLHVGGARTALFNWLFARRNGGVFVLRIEDTDVSRERPEFRDEIFNALRWLGIDEDEGPTQGGAYGPYMQSQRSAHYANALEQLKNSGALYPCFCRATVPAADGPEERAAAAPRCGCGSFSPTEQADSLAAHDGSPAYRMRVDQTQSHRVCDLIRGDVVFPAGEVEDFIVAKAGGAPLYNFAAVVDDAAMQISHIIRGEEHLANTPKQILLYQALGYPVPQFAHLPIILNTERHKLSKRDGATAVSDYEKSGFLPEALRNFLALLGWSPGDDREIMALEEIIAAFDLARVQKHGAVFDVVKLTWMNGEYLRKAPLESLVAATTKLIKKRADSAELRHDPEHVTAVCAMLQERAKTVAEIAGQTYLFSSVLTLAWDPTAVQKRAGDRAAHDHLLAIGACFAPLPQFDRITLETTLRGLAEQTGVKAGDYIGPLRVAITGVAVAPGIFELCEVLGRTVVLGRIQAFVDAHRLEVAP